MIAVAGMMNPVPLKMTGLALSMSTSQDKNHPKICLQAAEKKKMGQHQRTISKPYTVDSLDVFQETIGILVAEEIHSGGGDCANQKEHQAFSKFGGYHQFFTILLASKRNQSVG